VSLVASWARGSAHGECGRSWKGEGGKARGDAEAVEGGSGAAHQVFFSCRALSWGEVALETSGAMPSSPHGHSAAMPGHQTQCPADHIFQTRVISTFDLFSSPFYFQRSRANMR